MCVPKDVSKDKFKHMDASKHGTRFNEDVTMKLEAEEPEWRGRKRRGKRLVGKHLQECGRHKSRTRAHTHNHTLL